MSSISNPTCPTCSTSGRRVSAMTFGAHALPQAQARLGGAASPPAQDGWFLCRDAACPTVYFKPPAAPSPDVVVALAASDVRQLPYHKNVEDPEQLVCFCFQHTVGAVRADAVAHGVSKVAESIRAACGRGEDDCERTNPQGHCCLGNVGSVVHSALETGQSHKLPVSILVGSLAPHSAGEDTADDTEGCCSGGCCSG